MGFRMAPSVNVLAFINSNQFLNNNDTALMIRNSAHPQLWRLRANVTISKNAFKFNRGKYIISIGLNEDAPAQQLIFNQQNEVNSSNVIVPTDCQFEKTSFITRIQNSDQDQPLMLRWLSQAGISEFVYVGDQFSQRLKSCLLTIKSFLMTYA
ncbi:unnamed protein product [Cylicostephanus goldi]|uniref:Uncharacterized protein n=1 Tax=Cylicostephanus goldi TaxID=71465 RepID=A0A3P7N877_CYLGO|nr:unnamed protein product [Cylicostephanus goldi]